MAKPRRWPLGLALKAAFMGLLLVAGAACTTGEADRTESEAPSATSLESLLRIADATRAGGDLRTAVRVYRRAHDLYPQAPEPLVGLGESMSEVGAHREAVEAFRQALAREPENTGALRGLGSAMVALNETDLALAQFNKLLDIDPLDYRALNGMGVALDSVGRHEEAQEAYRAGLEIEKDDVSLRNNLGLSLAMSGQHQAAIALLRGLASEPDATPRTRQNLALALGLAGDMEAAAEISALDLTPQQVSENLAFIKFVRERADARTARAERSGGRKSGGESETDASTGNASSLPEPSNLSQPFLLSPGAALGPMSGTPRDKVAATEAETSTAQLDELEPSAGPATSAPEESEPEGPGDQTVLASRQDDGSTEAPSPEAHEPKESPGDSGPEVFQIQLSSQKNVVLAYRAWSGLRGRFPELLASYEPSISIADLGDRGLFFRLRTSPPTSRAVAEASCDAIKDRGADCFVVKQEEDSRRNDSSVDAPS